MAHADQSVTSSLTINTILAGAAAAAATLAIAGAMLVMTPRAAQATSAYATQTGKACGACHQNPAGGGKLTAAGEKFKSNGYK